MAKTSEDAVFLIINNIPKNFHASDLRNFFSSFIETGGFLCFHFRHRPEVQKPSDHQPENEKSRRVTNCCVVKVIASRAAEFIKSYNGEHWLDRKGESLMTCCFVKKIMFTEMSDTLDSESGACKRGTISNNLPLNRENFSHEDLNSLIEMHPPTFMPNGNVGTKTSHFLEEIRTCRLPPSLISKLGLQFPRNRARRIYGNVPFEYDKRQNRFHSAKLCKPEILLSKQLWSIGSYHNPSENEEHEQKKSESESESEEEEWDRHEAFHNDVTGQERTKERLFEEEIELKWEKGGSGLVFYTDAQFWDEKEGDFDAKTADDWDIDTSIYREPLAADKDSRDFVRMRQECALRDGTDTEIDRMYDFAAFEKYSRGFGRRLMEAQGWKQGLGIGKNNAGIPEPLLGEGQNPKDKKGFGYRGEKLIRQADYLRKPRKRRYSEESDRPFMITTAYDNPTESDPPETMLTTSAFSKLKYRREFLKAHMSDT